MKRTFTSKLQQWSASRDRHPLIIRGMRQVGKTWCVNDFAASAFPDNLVTIDFEFADKFSRIFENDLDPRRIVSELEALAGRKVVPGQTLLFFDEVQNCPRAIESLRYFYEQLPGLHVVAAGSLLDFSLRDISFPVGRVEFLDLQPMSLAEFLRATGLDTMADAVEGKPRALSPVIHEAILAETRKYMLIGGMPKAVQAWIDEGSYLAVRHVQETILDSFRQDFGKYRPRADPRALGVVFESVAKSVGTQLKYAKLGDEFTGTTNKKAFELLETARLVRTISAASAAGLPLVPAATRRFKAIMGDIGLMQAANKRPVSDVLDEKDLLAVYRGALAEQFVGQELAAANPSRQLCWWSREAKNSTAEVDYLVESDGGIQPIEVKSGSDGRLRSLHQLLLEHPGCRDGIVLSGAPFGERPESRLRFIPLYFAGRC